MQCQLAGRHRFEGQIVINAIYPIPRIMVHVEETSAIYSSIKIPSIFTIRARRKNCIPPIWTRIYENLYTRIRTRRLISHSETVKYFHDLKIIKLNWYISDWFSNFLLLSLFSFKVLKFQRYWNKSNKDGSMKIYFN